METVTIGADPEVYCWPALCRVKRGGFTTPRGRFGADGAGFPTGEFRPKPSNDPAEVVANIRSLMRSFVRSSVRQFRPAVALATPIVGSRAIGAHIHIGLPIEMRNQQTRADIAIALAAIAGPIIHLVEPAIWGSLRRISTSYGDWLDFRAQPHGVEWRYPSFWIAHPQMALGALSLAAVIAECAIRLKRRTICCLLGNVICRRRLNVDYSRYALEAGRRLTRRTGLRQEFDQAVDTLLSSPRVHPFTNILVNWVDPPETVVEVCKGKKQRKEVKERLTSLCRQTGAVIGIACWDWQPRCHNVEVPGIESEYCYDGIVMVSASNEGQLSTILQQARPGTDISIVPPHKIGKGR